MTSTPDGGLMAMIVQFLPFVAIFVLFYFLLIRPQQKRAKEHAALIGAVKRGDVIVLSSGLIGKVTRVEDAEVNVEIAPSVNVRVVKSMIADVRDRTAIAANDAKPEAKPAAKPAARSSTKPATKA